MSAITGDFDHGDGTIGFRQPAMRPLFDTRAALESMARQPEVAGSIQTAMIIAANKGKKDCYDYLKEMEDKLKEEKGEDKEKES